jgi:hypothetical protein
MKHRFRDIADTESIPEGVFKPFGILRGRINNFSGKEV